MTNDLHEGATMDTVVTPQEAAAVATALAALGSHHAYADVANDLLAALHGRMCLMLSPRPASIQIAFHDTTKEPIVETVERGLTVESAQAALKANGGNLSATARALNTDRRKVRSLLAEAGVRVVKPKKAAKASKEKHSPPPDSDVLAAAPAPSANIPPQPAPPIKLMPNGKPRRPMLVYFKRKKPPLTTEQKAADADMVAKFMATRGVTKLAPGNARGLKEVEDDVKNYI